MEKCEQCEKPVMYNFQGHLLCLSCYTLAHQIEQIEHKQRVEHLNYLTESMEATVGIYGVLLLPVTLIRTRIHVQSN